MREELTGRNLREGADRKPVKSGSLLRPYFWDIAQIRQVLHFFAVAFILMSCFIPHTL